MGLAFRGNVAVVPRPAKGCLQNFTASTDNVLVPKPELGLALCEQSFFLTGAGTESQLPALSFDRCAVNAFGANGSVLRHSRI